MEAPTLELSPDHAWMVPGARVLYWHTVYNTIVRAVITQAATCYPHDTLVTIQVQGEPHQLSVSAKDIRPDPTLYHGSGQPPATVQAQPPYEAPEPGAIERLAASLLHDRLAEAAAEDNPRPNVAPLFADWVHHLEQNARAIVNAPLEEHPELSRRFAAEFERSPTELRTYFAQCIYALERPHLAASIERLLGAARDMRAADVDTATAACGNIVRWALDDAPALLRVLAEHPDQRALVRVLAADHPLIVPPLR